MPPGWQFNDSTSKGKTMKRAAMMAILAVGLLIPFGAYGFECPKHFKATQQAIDKVMADMKGMGMMPHRPSKSR